MSHAGASKNRQDIDFKDLETELQKAIEADKKYWVENDAKIRAVRQEVTSYDEFRDIVKAAHLKPLNKSDKNKAKPKVWNSLASTNCASSEVTCKNISKMDEDATPNNCHKFEKQWRKLNDKSDEEKFEFLKRLGGTSIASIFKSEIVFGLLGEIILTLKTFDSYCVTDFILVVEILLAMSQAKRFNLTLQFLSSEEKLDCQHLFEKLWKAMGDKLQDLADSGISEITINNLMACYNVSLQKNP